MEAQWKEAEEQLRKKIMQEMNALRDTVYGKYVYIDDAPSDSDEVRVAFVTLLDEMLKGKDLNKVRYIEQTIRSADDIKTTVAALNGILSREPTAQDYPVGKMSVACRVCFEEPYEG